MPYANPSGVNGPRQGKSTGRLRQALTNLRTKQNVFPSELVKREVLPPKPKAAPARGGLQQPSQAEAPDLKAAVERLKTLTTVQVPQPQAPTPVTSGVTPTTVPVPAGAPTTPPTDLKGGTPKANMALGRNLAASLYGWTGADWQALKELWMRESGWRSDAVNSASGAAGIPQALPSAHPGLVNNKWMNDPALQIRWGLRYIFGRYGSPRAALAHSDRHHWY